MTYRRVFAPLTLIVALGAAFAAPARATVILALDVHQLVGRADRIFVGRVLATRSAWTADRRHIVTDATVQVEQDVHGTRAGQQVVVRRLGGTVNGIGMRVAGAPVLRRDDRVLLFTERRGGFRYVVGMQQGLYRVQLDPGGKPIVNRLLDGLALADRTPSGLRIAAPAAPRTLALDLMLGQLRKVIGECRMTPARCQSGR